MAKQYGTSLEGLAGKGFNQTFMLSSCTGSVRSSPPSCVVNPGTVMSAVKNLAAACSTNTFAGRIFGQKLGLASCSGQQQFTSKTVSHSLVQSTGSPRT